MNGQTIVFTSINLKYLANAQILADSVKSHHKDWRFVLLINDIPENELKLTSRSIDEVVYAHQLPIPQFHKWVLQYTVVELCTATKGVMALSLLSRKNCSKVVYLDPDTVVFSPLDDLDVYFKTSHVLLTPHLTDPEPTDYGIWSHEMAALKHGTFNLGFFSILNSVEGKLFLNWWASRLLKYSHIDFNAGLFTDQKWANLAPYLFEGIKVITDRAYNAATWNITNRRVARAAGGEWLINGHPLRFYHFSGFGSDFSWALKELAAFADPDDLVIDLWKWYQSKYLDEQRKLTPHDWAYDKYSDGVRITKEDRKWFSSPSSTINSSFPLCTSEFT
jgi:hypothetical protein